MFHKTIRLAGVLLLLAAIQGFAQGQEAASPASIPAATPSEMNCSGFISGGQLSQFEIVSEICRREELENRRVQRK